MKTIKTQTIDGHEIITGICEGSTMIDPVATRAKVDGIIQKSQEWRDLADKKNLMQKYVFQAQQAGRNAAKAKTQAEKNNFTQEWKTRWADIKKCQEEMRPLAVALQAKYSELTLANAIYFSLKPGETYVEDGEAETIETLMVEATANGEVLARDKTRVPDYRGRVYWKKSGSTWVRTGVTRLGEVPPSGAIIETELTDAQRLEISEQLDKERIAALSNQARAVEKEAVIQGLVGRAGMMKSELEVQGDNKALKTSQDWLTAETAKVMVKYG